MAERPALTRLILSADVPYARTPREAWPALAARARRLGANTIAVRPVWAWHALQSGEHDLDGRTDPRRDLTGLARLCVALGMGLAIDLSGLAELPGWLASAASIRMIAGADGQHWPDLRHPTLSAAARAWAEALAMTLRPLIASSHLSLSLLAADLPADLSDLFAEWFFAALPGVSIRDSVVAPGRAAEWGGSLGALRWPEGLASFRRDGSATVRAWRSKPLLMLLDVAGGTTDVNAPAAVGDDLPAWADGPDVAVVVRHAGDETLLMVMNRRAESYGGMLTYRGVDEALLHLHVVLGPGRSATVLLRGEEVAGAAFDGDASEGTWLARAMRSSAVYSGGAGGVMPCGAGVLLTAAHSGRFQLRRPEGWGEMLAFRLTMAGALLPAACRVESSHLIVPYVAEDERGQTDLYAVLPVPEPPQHLRGYLATLLVARAWDIRNTAARCEPALARDLTAMAERLTTLASGAFDLSGYAEAWGQSDQLLMQALDAPEDSGAGCI